MNRYNRLEKPSRPRRRLRVGWQAESPALRRRRCPVQWIVLQTGERLKRGCGRWGLMPFEAGWHCFYCGRYIYHRGPSLDSLWFHFRLAREYWRIQRANGRDFVNGMPVAGVADPLPRRLQADLSDPRPPPWFSVFIQAEDQEFQHYLQRTVFP